MALEGQVWLWEGKVTSSLLMFSRLLTMTPKPSIPHDDAHPSLRPLLSALGHWELCPAPGAWPGLLVRICDQNRENDGQRGSRFLMTLLKVKFTQTQAGSGHR